MGCPDRLLTSRRGAGTASSLAQHCVSSHRCTSRRNLVQCADVLTVAMWDLGTQCKPTSFLVPRVLRRVGADLVVLLRHEGPSPATVARQAGYRNRAALDLQSGPEVAVLSRFPLSDARTCTQSAGGLGHVQVHTSRGDLPLTVCDLGEAPAEEAAHALDECAHSCGTPWLAAGDLGHDLANPFGPWLSVRRNVIDPVQVSGAAPSGSRSHGFLCRGLEPRGAGTLLKAGGGLSDLSWVRLA